MCCMRIVHIILPSKLLDEGCPRWQAAHRCTAEQCREGVGITAAVVRRCQCRRVLHSSKLGLSSAAPTARAHLGNGTFGFFSPGGQAHVLALQGHHECVPAVDALYAAVKLSLSSVQHLSLQPHADIQSVVVSLKQAIKEPLISSQPAVSQQDPFSCIQPAGRHDCLLVFNAAFPRCGSSLFRAAQIR